MRSYSEELEENKQRVLLEMHRVNVELAGLGQEFQEITAELDRLGYSMFDADDLPDHTTVEQILLRAVTVPQEYDLLSYARFTSDTGLELVPEGGVFRTLDGTGVVICRRWSEIIGKDVWDPAWRESTNEFRWYTLGGGIRYYKLSEVTVELSPEKR